MSISIKVSYHRAVACFAQVDDDLEFLSEVYVSAGLTRKFRRIAAHRPDIILAMLREDKEAKRQVHPFVSVIETQIPIAHLAVNQQLCDTVAKHLSSDDAHGILTVNKEHLKRYIDGLRKQTGTISYVNGDRTDCRRSNLREFKPDEQNQELSQISHGGD